LFVGILATAAHPVQAQEQRQEKEPENTLGPLRITNTLIFAAVFGYFLYRTAPKFFNARSADIQKAIKDATGLKLEADYRYSEVDRKMATLAEEVKRMRDASAAEMEREHRRVRQDTEQGIARIHHSIANEIEAFRKQGIREVRQHTAEAALARAEQRLRERLGAAEPDDLVEDFIHLVERDAK
jgi:F-type H+-transporting ATPase subunit b